VDVRENEIQGGQVERAALVKYLESRFGKQIVLGEISPLGSSTQDMEEIKQFGFGRPLLVNFYTKNGIEKVVFHSIRKNTFGREREDDRVSAVWLDFQSFNELPQHVPALDMMIRTKAGDIQSVRQAEDMLLLTGFRPGQVYARDLIRIGDEQKLNSMDKDRACVLATYLAQIHQQKHESEALWLRRLRDLVGDGEGVMGLTDNYSSQVTFTDEDELRSIEEQVNRWRWKLKPLSHRLRQVHGDFHPYNVLFESGLDFHVLDRSRGAWGEPADDVSCMSINFLFFSLQRYDQLDGPFKILHEHFWETYFKRRGDEEILEVIQPWIAWRALVLASPVWYPDIEDGVRRKLIHFAQKVLASEIYDYCDINQYLEN
jgi:hypothetical protein